MNELSLFSGAGGGILGGVLLGWRTVCAVEIDPYARRVLLARQNDGCLQPFPVFDDVRSFDGTKWRDRVDIVTGGFPCQDISCAGKGAGITGERSGLWKEMYRIIREVRPHYALIENSPMLTIRGLDTVLCDIAEMGYDARWGVVGAHHAGAPHKRDRIWIMAYTKGNGIGRESQDVRCEDGRQIGSLRGEPIGTGEESENISDASCGKPREQTEWEGRENLIRRSEKVVDVADSESDGREPRRARNPDEVAERRESDRSGIDGKVADANSERREEQRRTIASRTELPESEFGDWWKSEPDVGRLVDGLASRVDRLRCLGNGQVPAVVRLAWKILT